MSSDLILTVNPTAIPVQWGALAIAASHDIEIRYDHEANPISLDAHHTSIATDPFAIIENIGEAAALSSDSAKVCIYVIFLSNTAHLFDETLLIVCNFPRPSALPIQQTFFRGGDCFP
jgi:hypothetical protein